MFEMFFIQLVIVLLFSHILYMTHLVKIDKKADAQMLSIAMHNKHEKELDVHELTGKHQAARHHSDHLD